MSGIVSRLSVLGKVWLGLAAGAMALIIFCLAAPGSSLFFPLVSLWCNAALFALALLVLRRAGVELDLFHKAVLVGVWAVAALYFFWALGSRTFLYYWDYVNYILKQYNAEAAFAQSTGAGFRFLLDSITEDYTNFITLFTEFPFCLSGKTGDDYAFCQVFSVLPSLLVLLAGLTVKVGRMLRVKNRFWYFLIGFSWCATFPFVRMSAVLGQPDWFGLIFAFMLMLLTLDYRFDGIDLPRYLLIFAATAGVILTRRWYLYFVVGYCFAYVLLLVVSSVRLAKSGQQSRAVHRLVRLAVFGLCAAGAMVLLLLPMVRKILGFDYAGRYSYYNFGGGCYRRSVVFISGVVPADERILCGVLGVQGRLQSPGAQGIVRVKKDDILAVRCGQTAVARTGNAQIVLMDDRHAGVPRGPGIAQFSAVVGAAVIDQNTGDRLLRLLGDDALHAAVKRGHGLVDRHDNGDGRLAHRAPPVSIISCAMRTNSA